MRVSAAIIRNEQGQILICQRPAHKHHGSLWEFPGGKQESGESPENCLIRECFEELDIRIEVDRLFAENESDLNLHLSFFECHQVAGALQLLEHQRAIWVPISALAAYRFCPADQQIIQVLQEGFM